MTRETLVAALTLLADTYRTPLADGAFEGYWIALNDLHDSEIENAVRSALKHCKFMPTPAELRERRKPDMDLVALTSARLRRLECIPATAEEIARSRREVGIVVRQLAEAKAVKP